MLVGALVLLASSILDAVADPLPRPVYYALFFTGYVFLAYGFFTALSARRDATTKKRE